MPVPPPSSHVEAEQLFDRIAEDYQARSAGQVFNVSSMSFARRQELVTEEIAILPRGATVLDYGMGPAVFGPPCAQRALRYVGIDISPRMVELARAQNLSHAEFHIGDLDCLVRFQASADAVLLIGLIDYLAEPADGLTRLAACVKPGGRMVISFRNHRSLPRWLRNTCKAIWSRLHPQKPDKGETTAFAAPVLENSFVPQRDLIPVLREAGFRSFDVRYLDCSPVFFNLPLPRPLWRMWKWADGVLARPVLAGFCASGVLVASNKP